MGHPYMANRPIAIRFISAYLLLKAATLAFCFASVHYWPKTKWQMKQIIESIVPTIAAVQRGHQDDFLLDVWLAPVFVVIDSALGLGIWFLQRWARTLVVIDLTWLYGRALVGLIIVATVYRDSVRFVHPTIYFEINLLAGIIMLAALVDPDVKRAFGIRI